jgi:hypothetical protein
MKKSSDTIENRSRDLPVCSAVPQPTAPPAACPVSCEVETEYLHIIYCLDKKCNTKIDGWREWRVEERMAEKEQELITYKVTPMRIRVIIVVEERQKAIHILSV